MADAAIDVLVQIPQHHHGLDQKDRPGPVVWQPQIAPDPAHRAKLLLPLSLLFTIELIEIKAAGVVDQRGDILRDVGAAAPQPHQTDGRKVVGHGGARFTLSDGGRKHRVAQLFQIGKNAGQIPFGVVEVTVACVLLIIRADR